MDLDTTVGIATVIAVAFAGYSALVAAKSFRAQVRATDTGYVLSLMDKLGQAWEAYITHTGDHDEFYFGQLLALYETACYLINRDMVGKGAVNLLEAHIVEVMVGMLGDEGARTSLTEAVSGPDTHKEIMRFLATRSNLFHEQQAFVSGLEARRQGVVTERESA